MPHSTDHKLKVMFINRPRASWLGGDYVQMEKTADELRKLGCEVDVEDNPLPTPALKMYLYDVIHVWNFSMEWARYAVWAGVSKKLTTVCSMIYHESDNWISYKDQQLMLDSLDGLIFLTEGEKDRVRRHCTLDELKSVTIPNGLDSFWVGKYEKGDYLLTVGRLEASKGQLAVARVAKRMGLKYKCVGERYDKTYADQVEAEGAELLGKTEDRDRLKEIYKGCLILVVASRAELMPLVVMEAGAQGKQIVLTNHCEWKVPAEYVEWNDEISIEDAIKKQLEKGENKELKSMVKGMTWAKTAQDLLKFYGECINRNTTRKERLSKPMSSVAQEPDLQRN